MTASLRRASWSTVLERDIDLLILDLLHTSSQFREWLLQSVANDLVLPGDDPEFLGAWHSVNTPNGESDIEAEWQLAGGARLVVLIEEKLGAAFQPDQGLRYRERAENYISSGRATRSRTVLAAPGTYRERDPVGAGPFERHVTLESILEWCRSEASGERYEYLARFMEHALLRSTPRSRGTAARHGQPSRGGKPQYPEMYALIREIMERDPREPALTIRNSTPGEWVHLWFEGRGAGISLRWRLPDHWAELVVKAARVQREALERALADNPLAGAAVADRGRTEHVVWVATPEIDLLGPAAPQADAVSTALDISAGLAGWYVAVRDSLDRTGAEPTALSLTELSGGVR